MTRPTWDQRVAPYIDALPWSVKLVLAVVLPVGCLYVAGVIARDRLTRGRGA